jgi:hypothetical protein
MIALPSASAADDCSVSSYFLQVSTAPDRSNPTLLYGVTLSNRVYIFLNPEVGPSSVRFFLDGGSIRTVSVAPWDFGAAELQARTPGTLP